VKRPALITLLAGFQFLAAFLLLLGGAVELNDRRLGVGRRTMFDTEVAVLAIVFGTLSLLCGLGLWRLRRYGRRIQIALAVCTLILFPVGTIAGAVVLVYMWTPGIRVLFSGRPPADLTAAERARVATVTERPGSRAVWVSVGVLLVGGAAIGTVYMIAKPSLVRSRIAANEAAAVASMRTILSAQASYAAAGGGGYATRLSRLAIRCPGSSNGFVPGDLAEDRSRTKGYIFGMESVGAPAGPVDCNGAPTETDFYGSAEPMNNETGKRAFSTSAAGIVYEAPELAPSAHATLNRTASPVK
jgi:hypothetical protein